MSITDFPEIKTRPTLYSASAIAELISFYIDHGGNAVEVEEGVLGYGLTVCSAPGYKTAVVRETYLNEWSSGHTVRMYNETPKKYRRYTEED